APRVRSANPEVTRFSITPRHTGTRRVWQRFATKWAIRALISGPTWPCEKQVRLPVGAREETDTPPADSRSRHAKFAIRRRPRTRFAFRENPACEQKAAEYAGYAGL